MQELAQAISDVDAMLALAPEELGAKLLLFAKHPRICSISKQWYGVPNQL